MFMSRSFWCWVLVVGSPALSQIARDAVFEVSLKVTESAEAVAVDTLALQFAISKGKPFALFDVVRIGGERVLNGGRPRYDQLQGRVGWNDEAKWKPRTLVVGPPASVKVCCAGPLRTTIEMAGKFTGDALGVGYKAWITA